MYCRPVYSGIKFHFNIHTIDFRGNQEFICLISQLQDSIQVFRLTTTARDLSVTVFSNWCTSSFLLVHLLYITLFAIISHYQLMFCFCLTHSCQMTHFLICITLSNFELATSSHIHGWHSTMIAGVCCTDFEHHLITATVLHGMHFFVNSPCCTSFV